MKNLITTIEQVSKEVKNKISKMGTLTLKNKYDQNVFEGEELVAAEYYLIKRGAISQLPVKSIVKDVKKGSFGKHRSQMNDQELVEAQSRFESRIEQAKAKAAELNSVEVEDSESNEQVEAILPCEVKVDKIAKDKKTADPIIKLTEQESTLFERIKIKVEDLSQSGHSGKDLLLSDLSSSFESLREFKGVLGSLKKKNIVCYDESNLTLDTIGEQMIKGTLPYKQKDKHEQNFFRKPRVVVEVDGKPLEKSAYVRQLLRKNNRISCSELNEALSKMGFAKLYHSELQRCKTQLGIVTVKEKE